MTLKNVPWGDYPSEIFWDEINEGEFWKHGVRPMEVERCLHNSGLKVWPYDRKARVRLNPEKYQSRYRVIGVTDGGRKLEMYVDDVGDECIYPITGWDYDEKGRKNG